MRRTGTVGLRGARSLMNGKALLLTLTVASCSSTGGQPSSTESSPASDVYLVSLTASSSSALPKCTSSLAGTTAYVQSPAGLWSCQGDSWISIPCAKVLAGAVAYASATKTLWACVSGSWTQVVLPAGPPGATGATGATGVTGPTGPAGQTGAPGASGTSCWDLNGNGLCDLSTEDKDGNGVCNAADCQGSPGATGVQGPQGTSGQNGTSCSVVDNGNGTKTIVCQDGTQATVGDGANGTNGTNGANGTACWDLNSNGKCDLPGEDKDGNGVCDVADCQGTTGKQGQNSLISLATEPSGSHCTFGGVKIEAGLDTNGNGALDGSEIFDTAYVCSGAPVIDGGAPDQAVSPACGESSGSGTTVSGSILTDQVWTLSGSPYRLTGDVTIPPSVTLTIWPCVRVLVSPSDSLGSGVNPSRVEITVLGQINIYGGADSPVFFEGLDNTSPSWQGITLSGAQGIIDGIRISNAQQALVATNSRVLQLSHATFVGNTNALLIDGQASVVDSVFAGGSSGTAISVSGGNLGLSHVTIDGWAHAFVVSGGASVVVQDGIVTSNLLAVTISPGSSFSSTFTDFALNGDPTSPVGQGNIYLDPRYLGPGIYNLSSDSPAIGSAHDGSVLGGCGINNCW